MTLTIGRELNLGAHCGHLDNTDLPCGLPAVRHIFWDTDATNGFACDIHLGEALGCRPFTHHAIGDGDCCGAAGLGSGSGTAGDSRG